LKLPAAEPTRQRIPENRDEFDGIQHRIILKLRPAINAYLALKTDVVNALTGIQATSPES